MPTPAANIIGQAGQIAKAGNITTGGAFSGYVTQALISLNSLLEHIARTMDFSSAMDTYNFNLNPNLVNLGTNVVQASPNLMPMDYLRVQTSGGSSGAQRSTKYYIDGVPYDMVEIDLTEWDDQVQQAGIQSYPYFAARDMSQSQILFNITGDLDTQSTTVANVPSTAGIIPGMSISGGYGPTRLITPGTTIIATSGTSPGTLTLSQLPSLKQINSLAANFHYVQTGCSLLVGFPPVLLIYPPASGAFQSMIRYLQLQPPLTQAQVDAGAYCWFTDDMALIEGLAGLLMRYTGDDRAVEYIGAGIGTGGGRYGARMAQYIKTADDKSNRAETVMLDRRVFGASFSTLKNTKRIGWTILLFCAKISALATIMCAGGC